MAHGKGNSTSGSKKRPGVGTRAGENFKKGEGMDQIKQGETPADPAAEIEALHSDTPTEDLPPDAAAIRRKRGDA